MSMSSKIDGKPLLDCLPACLTIEEAREEARLDRAGGTAIVDVMVLAWIVLRLERDRPAQHAAARWPAHCQSHCIGEEEFEPQ